MKFKVMDHTGHSIEEFDKANKVSIDEAMKRFDELTQKERKFAAVPQPPGSATTLKRIHAFDPNAEEIVFSPALKGG